MLSKGFIGELSVEATTLLTVGAVLAVVVVKLLVGVAKTFSDLLEVFLFDFNLTGVLVRAFLLTFGFDRVSLCLCLLVFVFLVFDLGRFKFLDFLFDFETFLESGIGIGDG